MMTAPPPTAGFNRYNPPSPSLASDDGRDDAHFDVEQLRDELPQPFRRADHLLSDIFERAWEIIDKHEVEVQYKLSTKRDIDSVVYEEERLLGNVHVTAMCGDASYLFIACGDGAIMTIELAEMSTVAKTDKFHEEMVIGLHLLCSGDDWAIFSSHSKDGRVTVIGFHTDEFHLIQEIPEGTDSKSVVQIFFSDDGEFMALDFQDESPQKHHVEVFKLPIAQWSQEIGNTHMEEIEEIEVEEVATGDVFDAVESTTVSAAANPSQDVSPRGLASSKRQPSGQSIMSSKTVASRKTDPTADDARGRQSSLSNKSERRGSVIGSQSAVSANKMETQFSKCSPLLTINPPSITPSNVPSISAALKPVSTDAGVIGSGVNHLLTTAYFESFAGLLVGGGGGGGGVEDVSRSGGSPDGNSSHYQFSPVLNSNATIHFLKGQLNTSLFPSKTTSDSYNAVALWWENGNQLFTYSLKTKDTDAKPISVLPHASPIRLTAVNERTELIAFALRDGCIVVWNRYTAQPIRAVMSMHNEELTHLHFTTVLRRSVHINCLTYATKNGRLWQMSCIDNKLADAVAVDDRSSKLFADDEVHSVSHGPRNQLSLIWNSGSVLLYDESKCRPVCRLELFHEESGIEPDGKNLLLCNNKDTIVMARVEKHQIMDKEKVSTRLFLYAPRHHKILKEFYGEPVPVKDTPDVETLKDHFLRFLSDRKKTNSALQARAKQRREQYLKMNWTKATALAIA